MAVQVCSEFQELWWGIAHQPRMSADRQQVRTAFLMKGPLERGVLTDSLNKLADRHELLRARFSGTGRTIPNRAGWLGGERPERIEQHIAAHNEAELVHIDCRGVAPEDRTAHATALVYEIGDRPFDLERGPAWRTALMEFADDEHVLLLVVHHIVCDFRSVGLLWTDLKAIYEALLAKREPDLEPLTTSYAEFAESMRQTLDGPIGDRERAYWQRRLEGAKPIILAPDVAGASAEVVSPFRQTFPVLVRARPIPAEIAQRVAATMSLRQSCFYLAALVRLMQERTSSNDICVTVTYSLRPKTFDGVVGTFTQMLPLRFDAVPDEPAELMNQVMNEVRQTWANRHVFVIADQPEFCRIGLNQLPPLPKHQSFGEATMRGLATAFRENFLLDALFIVGPEMVLAVGNGTLFSQAYVDKLADDYVEHLRRVVL